jgi:uncharacterized membrane protein YedE/YeeE
MIIAGLICGFIFGWGLLISGLINPAKVLAFLDVLSAQWDPSLLVVMMAALAVGGIGYEFARRRAPLFAECNRWPEKTTIDAPLVAGAALFGVGWGITGLCPGPALGNLASLSPQIIVFVIAMSLGMLAHDLWQRRRVTGAKSALATEADG